MSFSTEYKRRVTFQSLMVTLCTNKFTIQQLYALLTLYLCVLYLSQNKQRLIGFYNRDEKCLQRGRTGSLNKAVCALSLKG